MSLWSGAAPSTATHPDFPRHARLWERVEPRTPVGELAHDRQHVLRVYRWCLRLAPEAGASVDLAGAAGLVHDLVSVPKHLAARPLGGERSAAAAAGLLPEVGYTPSEVAIVVDAVATHSWSRGLKARSPEGMVLQDADRLDAIGFVGALRNAAVAQSMASAAPLTPCGPRALLHPHDPAHEGDRPLEDGTWAVDHWWVKLLQLREGMHFQTARLEAERRHRWMVAALAELQREWDATRAPPDNGGGFG